METIQHLKWRYAVKRYTPEKVSEAQIDQILNAINLSASSCGIQPYRTIVISDPELKRELGKHSFNQQISDSSHLIVFAAFNDISSTYIEEYIQMAERQRDLPAGGMDGLKDSLISYFGPQSPHQQASWADRQAYIGLGTALIAAAELKIDTTPMEGFDAGHFDQLLGLKEQGLHTTVILSLGYRDSDNDFLANLAKVRLPLDVFSVRR